MKYLVMMISLVAIGFFATSCSEDNTLNPTGDLAVDGQWAGNKDLLGLGDLKVELSLVELVDVIGGTGDLTLQAVSTQPITVPLIVTGSFDSPNVTLNFTGTGITFDGKLSSDNKKMTGTLISKDNPVLMDFETVYEFVKQ
ncbi:MAG: hypothetical protein KAH48_03995 [Chlorobi bacterium]|nr:hypothetical protein [Chlorobiota bacterium]